MMAKKKPTTSRTPKFWNEDMTASLEAINRVEGKLDDFIRRTDEAITGILERVDRLIDECDLAKPSKKSDDDDDEASSYVIVCANKPNNKGTDHWYGGELSKDTGEDRGFQTVEYWTPDLAEAVRFFDEDAAQVRANYLKGKSKSGWNKPKVQEYRTAIDEK